MERLIDIDDRLHPVLFYLNNKVQNNFTIAECVLMPDIFFGLLKRLFFMTFIILIEIDSITGSNSEKCTLSPRSTEWENLKQVQDCIIWKSVNHDLLT